MNKLVLLPLAVAALILIDHKRNHGIWLEWSDINSHEAVALLLVGIWLGLMVR